MAVVDPATTVRDVGEAEIEKPLTTRLTVAVRTREPLVPVTVIGYVPPTVVASALKAKVDVPAPVTDAGVNTAEAPAGSPVVVRATAPVKPPRAPIVTVEFTAAAPGVTVTEVGEAAMVKSALTTNVAGMFCTKEPLVARMVKL